jgi:tetratricopeptide (TPR) repeat protein
MAAPTPSIEKLIKKLEKEPNPLIYLQLAEEYRRERLYQEALKTCQDGLQRHPNYWSARVSMGRIHYETGEREKAREELEKVIKAVPDNLLANKLLGDIYRESGKYEEALKRYNLVQMLTPADAEVAASIRKIEEMLRSKEPDIKMPAATFEMAVPTPELRTSPSFHEEDAGFSSAPTTILSRADLRQAIPTEDLPAETVRVHIEEIAEEDAHPPLVDVRFEKRLRYVEEEEAIELKEDSEREEVDELTTQTLAEIYIQQGLPDKAIKVYQKLLLKDPANTEITQKLRDMNPAEVLISAAGRDEPVRSEFKIPEPERETPRRRLPGAFSDVRRRKISTLESWLAAIRRERA